jgi:hypothetical protein
MLVIALYCISGTYLAIALMKKELGSQDKQKRLCKNPT